MSPRLLHQLLHHRNGMATAELTEPEGPLVWKYGAHPIGKDYLRTFKELRRWDQD